MDETPILWSDAVGHLPPPVTNDEIDDAWHAAVNSLPGKILVLDDDPTGVQTVHSIPVYTTWDDESLVSALREDTKVVYVLTNSRALTEADTEVLHREIAVGLREAARKTNEAVSVVSRSDSTLRGHYPCETTVLREVLRRDGDFDGEIIVPFFSDGGRLTIDDIHYVRDDAYLIPAAQTEFARDAVFGYRASDLTEWVAEKTNGAFPSETVRSVSLDMLRRLDIDAVEQILLDLHDFSKVIVNAVDDNDLKVFVVALARALGAGKRFLFRTAASFVRVFGGIGRRPLLGPPDLYVSGGREGAGIVVVGSYVEKTTRQVDHLRRLSGIEYVEWDVSHSVDDAENTRYAAEIQKTVARILEDGCDVCLATSRAYWKDHDTRLSHEAHLRFGRRISHGLVSVVKKLTHAPGYIVGKGGITSSDIGVHGLAVRRAMVLGQIQPGVPVWRLGEESRFPGMPYVVFPGNVGGDETLTRVVTTLRSP